MPPRLLPTAMARVRGETEVSISVKSEAPPIRPPFGQQVIIGGLPASDVSEIRTPEDLDANYGAAAKSDPALATGRSFIVAKPLDPAWFDRPLGFDHASLFKGRTAKAKIRPGREVRAGQFVTSADVDLAVTNGAPAAPLARAPGALAAELLARARPTFAQEFPGTFDDGKAAGPGDAMNPRDPVSITVPAYVRAFDGIREIRTQAEADALFGPGVVAVARPKTPSPPPAVVKTAPPARYIDALPATPPTPADAAAFDRVTFRGIEAPRGTIKADALPATPPPAPPRRVTFERNRLLPEDRTMGESAVAYVIFDVAPKVTRVHVELSPGSISATIEGELTAEEARRIESLFSTSSARTRFAYRAAEPVGSGYCDHRHPAFVCSLCHDERPACAKCHLHGPRELLCSFGLCNNCRVPPPDPAIFANDHPDASPVFPPRGRCEWTFGCQRNSTAWRRHDAEDRWRGVCLDHLPPLAAPKLPARAPAVVARETAVASLVAACPPDLDPRGWRAACLAWEDGYHRCNGPAPLPMADGVASAIRTGLAYGDPDRAAVAAYRRAIDVPKPPEGPWLGRRNDRARSRRR
jgi:hypothetical protein